MSSLETELDALAAETGFSGVVRVDRGETTELAKAYGLAHRGHEIPNTVDTRFAIASGTKGLTALAVVSLIEDGPLELDDDRPLGARRRPAADRRRRDGRAPAGAPLGHRRLPRRGRGATTSTDYVMPVPVHELATTEQYLAVLDGHPTKFAPGERFAYCNGGYVVLALIAERASGVPFHELVQRARVRAGRHGRHRVPALRRASRRAPRSATSTVDGARGPTCSTCRCAAAATAGSTRPPPTSARSGARSSPGGSCRPSWVGEMVRPRSDVPRESMRYGLGFWLHAIDRRRDAGGLRRRRVVPQRARPGRAGSRTP